MESILAWGIEFIAWLQQPESPALQAFFALVTKFGGSFYLYMFPFLFWCVDFRTAIRVGGVFTLTLLINTTLKEWIGQPRPFQMDLRVISEGEQGYGLPSGHAQLTVAFWGVIAAWMDWAWFWWLAVVIMFLVGFSRIYLGVHFPSDVIAGWGLGALTLWGAIHYREQIEGWLAGNELAGRIGIAVGVGLAVFLFDALLVRDHGNLNAGAAGFIAGGGVGTALARRYLDFDGRGPWWQRGLRFILGTALMLMMLGLFRAIGAPDGFAGRLVIAFDLVLLGLWLTFAAPWIFEWVRLSPRTCRTRQKLARIP